MVSQKKKRTKVLLGLPKLHTGVPGFISAQLPIQFPANALPDRHTTRAHVAGPLSPPRDTQPESQFLASAWFMLDYHGPLGREPQWI